MIILYLLIMIHLMKNLKKTICYMAGSIKINVINEIKNGLEMIETEKNYNEIIKKNNDEIIDFAEKRIRRSRK